MKQIGKRAVVIGLGVSGFESAKFLSRRGFQVFAADQSWNEVLASRQQELVALGVQTKLNFSDLEILPEADWALISPGISPDKPIYRQLVQKNIPIYSEIEVAGWFCPTRNIIAVTGTCGKTTVSTLIHRMLEMSGKRSFLCGNIGNPFIGELEKIKADDFVVLEVSSFQLMHCRAFRPHIGILLNIAPNHLDWHASMEEYAGAKLRMFQKQEASDYAFIRSMDRESFFSGFEFPGKIIFVGESAENPNREVIRKVARVLSIDSDAVEQIFDRFQGIEHRMEEAADYRGVKFINDSKSTTPYSLRWALSGFEDGRVLLIAGGRAKSDDFSDLGEIIQRKVKTAYLIGESREKISRAWKAYAPAVLCATLQEAVEKAFKHSAEGDAVLLSPACASFDMFKNYQDRGNQFKKIAKTISAGLTVSPNG